MRGSSLLLLLLPLLAGCAAGAGARRAATPLLLTGAGGEQVPLDALAAGREATVLVFWSAGCPCVRRYQARVDALADAWPAARVRVVGVASNAGEPFAESLAAARERGVRIPLYRDEGGAVAEALGARSTPTVVLLDRQGEVRFRGWFDNERLPGEEGREAWLERALAGLLAGETGFPARSPVYGCAITRSLFDPPAGSCCSARP